MPTAGRIANGALVERRLPAELENEKSFTLELINPDFATATRAADVINDYTLDRYNGRAARARDLRAIVLLRPPGLDAARFIAEVGELPIETDTPAKIVIDEKTGTVVIGRDVRVSPVAVAHGSITVRVTETPQVVQPAPFSRGRTETEQRTTIAADEAGGALYMVAGPNLQTLVSGLNRMGLKPLGIIAILQAIKSAGALQAELVVQ